MTNEAILSVLTNLCNQARNSAHTTFGLIELHRNRASDSTLRACLETARSSADRLLEAMDDFRELLSGATAAPGLVEDFDLMRCLNDTIELLNLASGEKMAQIHLEASQEPQIIRQDRHAVEQVLTRILDASSKLTEAGELHVAASILSGRNAVRCVITPPDSGVAVRVANWLNADPDQFSFQGAAEASLELAAMVAGRRLRALGGTAELVPDSGKPPHVAVQFHSQSDGTACVSGLNKTQPDVLNILLTEDCDDSFALTELLLRNENVWRARNGLEALDMVKKRRFDVAFMDVHMPGMDGYATIRAIRDWETLSGNARTPVVVLSSDDLETQRRSAAQSGCSGFLRKPLRNSALLDLLERLKATRSLVS